MEQPADDHVDEGVDPWRIQQWSEKKRKSMKEWVEEEHTQRRKQHQQLIPNTIPDHVLMPRQKCAEDISQ